MRRRLVLIADGPSGIDAVRLALRNAQSLRLVATLDGRRPAPLPLGDLRPHVVVIDDLGHRTNTLMRIVEATTDAPGASVVVLTHTHDPVWLAEAGEAGADLVARKRAHPAELGSLLRIAADSATPVREHRARPGVTPPARQARTSA